ncbi:MAG: hypothetical protein KGD63_07080 [Candidatus Lokiarchaeota archaeon]|nr:hypothetical protein [Candidatus Lokiarchaeota archaeon]
MSEKKDSNELLNIILIALGGLFIFLGIISVLIDAGIAITLPIALYELTIVFGSTWLVSIVIGVWALISGIGMFKEEEWAMGQALVVLSIMAVVGVQQLYSIVQVTDWFTQWVSYIPLIATIIGVIGFLWLLVTRKRYD